MYRLFPSVCTRLGLAIVTLILAADVTQAGVISVGTTYAWFDHAPGQNPNSGPHYLDDVGNGGGLHAVHLLGGNNFGAYSLGELTDGIKAASVVGGANQQGLVQHSGAPAARIVFDLGSTFNVESIEIGALVNAGTNNNAPDDVSISFSPDGSSGSYSTPEFFDLEALYGPLSNGHTDLLADVTDTVGQFVMLDFDGGSMAEPGGSNPNEKWSIDEVTINGGAAPAAVPEPASIAIWSLLGLALAGYGYRRRRRNS